MEVVLLASCLNTLLPKLWERRNDGEKRQSDIERNLKVISRGIPRLVAALEAAKFKGAGRHCPVKTAFNLEAKVVSQETRDCIQSFYKNKKVDTRTFESKTKSYMEAIENLCTRIEGYTPIEKALEKPQDLPVANPMGMDGSRDELLELVQLAGAPEGGRKVISIVGFPGLGKTVLAKMVYDKDRMSCVQESSATNTVDCTLRARVTAAAKDADEVLREILKQLDKASKDESPKLKKPQTDTIGKYGNLNLAELSAHLQEHFRKKSVTAEEEAVREILEKLDTDDKHENPKFEKPQADTPVKYENRNLDALSKLLQERLLKKRYLIVIDDIQSTDQWEGINAGFPKNGDGNGTIIVTTTIQSVANVCSSCNGYVYKLSPLNKVRSLGLFLEGRTSWDGPETEGYASDILKKCDGLPLAIVSMSDILQGQGGPSTIACKDACTELDNNLVEGGPSLKRLRWVLMNKYIGLDGDDLRSCLLYFSMYKHGMGAVPRRNSLIRRWEAEGFLVPDAPKIGPTDVGTRNLKTLVDRNIIQPMEVSINGVVRRCKPPGMMLEYISKISMSENFAALVSDAVNMPNSRIRRLSFHAGSDADDQRILAMDLSIVRTLAVFGEGSTAILNFEMYDLIEVLELKECTNLEDKHVKYICQLLFLKYLSLGDSIGEIPKEISHLELLETLQLRTTGTVMVYRAVLELPKLKHLLGNFMLKGKPNLKLYKFLEEKSHLETTTGFVTETTIGFPDLMCHMRKLRKVKIKCTRKASDSDLEGLRAAIQAFTAEGTNMSDQRSLSIDFGEFHGGRKGLPTPLEFLKATGSVVSLKLLGDWRPFVLPDFQYDINISGITKLCLSRTYLRGNDALARLKSLIALDYLKLDEAELGPLDINPGTFQCLKRLCLVGEATLYGIKIHPGALLSLQSLHLICKALQPGLHSSIGIRSVRSLEEIALHSEVAKSIKDAWKGAAMDHPKRPAVLNVQSNLIIYG